MRRKSWVICFVAFLILGLAFQQTVPAKTLFWDDFKDGKMGKAYKLVGCDKWVEKDGIFQQPDLGIPRDPCHAIIIDPAEYPEEITIQGLVRMDVWNGGDFARAGLAVRLNPDTSQGLNLLFHNDLNTVQVLNDLIAWGPSIVYKFETGKWYWFKLHVKGKDTATIEGKVWTKEEKEPGKFMIEWSQGGRSTGFPGLNGGSGPGARSTVSFDDISVWDKDGPTVDPFSLGLAVEPVGKLTSAWGRLKLKD